MGVHVVRVLSYYTQGQSTYLTLLDMRCYSIQSIGVATWDVGTHSYAGAYTRSTAKLYIGDLRGRNISTPPSPDLRSALWQSYAL